MKITYKGDYALKTILDLAVHYGNEPVTSHDLAERIDAPVKFLEQVLAELKKGGFVVSRRGSVGGYTLAKIPSQITVGDIVRVVDGPIEPISCVQEGYTDCADVNRCVLKGVWQRVARATSDIVDQVTFEDLVNQVNAKQALVYSI